MSYSSKEKIKRAHKRYMLKGKLMYKLFLSILVIIWVLDILNLPFMDFMDMEIPVNTLAWMLIWIFIPESNTVIRHEKSDF